MYFWISNFLETAAIRIVNVLQVWNYVYNEIGWESLEERRKRRKNKCSTRFSIMML